MVQVVCDKILENKCVRDLVKWTFALQYVVRWPTNKGFFYLVELLKKLHIDFAHTIDWVIVFEAMVYWRKETDYKHHQERVEFVFGTDDIIRATQMKQSSQESSDTRRYKDFRDKYINYLIGKKILPDIHPLIDKYLNDDSIGEERMMDCLWIQPPH